MSLKTESIELFLIEPPPNVVEQSISLPQIAFDRARTDPESRGDVTLGAPFEAMLAKYGQRPRRKLLELALHDRQPALRVEPAIRPGIVGDGVAKAISKR